MTKNKSDGPTFEPIGSGSFVEGALEARKPSDPEKIYDQLEKSAHELINHLIERIQYLDLDQEHTGYHVAQFFRETYPTDVELYAASLILQKEYEEAVRRGDEKMLDIYRSLLGRIFFTLGQREGESYTEVAATQDRIFLLPDDVNPFFVGHEGVSATNAIESVGVRYPGGSSGTWGSEGPHEATPLTWDHLVCVRRTSHPIRIRERSPIVEQSSRLPTLHWTLNAPVRPHSGSSWTDQTMTIFAPARSLIEKNGPPLSMNNVNTIWYEQDIVLPPHTVILVEKNFLQNIPEEFKDEFHCVPFRFTSTHDRLLLERLIIHKMGYSFFAGSMWPDPRIGVLLEILKSQHGILGSIELDREYDREYLDGLLYAQQHMLNMPHFRGSLQ